MDRNTLERAFRAHEAAIAAVAGTPDWEPFVQLFTPDAEYHDPMVGTMSGQEAFRPWVQATLGTFPGSAMHFETRWHLLDEEHGRVVCELANIMRDPGDGSVHEATNITILEVAEDGRLRSERDVYDSPAFIALIEGWGRRAHELGTLTEDEVAWFAATMPTAVGLAPSA